MIGWPNGKSFRRVLIILLELIQRHHMCSRPVVRLGSLLAAVNWCGQMGCCLVVKAGSRRLLPALTMKPFAAGYCYPYHTALFCLSLLKVVPLGHNVFIVPYLSCLALPGESRLFRQAGFGNFSFLNKRLEWL